MKFAINQEIRDWIVLYGQSCNTKYQKELNHVLKFIENIEKRLSREIKDLEDIRLVMMAVKELRENEIEIDMNITPIEESYGMLQLHGINIAREDIERAESLRYRWAKLQNRCVSRNHCVQKNQHQFNGLFLKILLDRCDIIFTRYSIRVSRKFIEECSTI